jgi:hypothetical protein
VGGEPRRQVPVECRIGVAQQHADAGFGRTDECFVPRGFAPKRLALSFRLRAHAVPFAVIRLSIFPRRRL